MVRREFGSAGVKIPVIGQGTWQTRKDGLDALRAGIELGMTHIDTAEMYTGSEEVIAEAIHGIALLRIAKHCSRRLFAIWARRFPCARN